MPIMINLNICDNSPECSGIEVCDYDVITWDEGLLDPLGKKGVLHVDNSKCTSCGACVGENGCPVGAIIFTESFEELKKIEKDVYINIDTVRSLFVDRYGAEPIDNDIYINVEQVQNILNKKNGIVLLEEFAEWSIECLLTSIPVELIVRQLESITTKKIHYYKCNCTHIRNGENTYPVLLIFEDSKFLGKIEGYLDNDEFDKMITSLKQILE